MRTVHIKIPTELLTIPSLPAILAHLTAKQMLLETPEIPAGFRNTIRAQKIAPDYPIHEKDSRLF